MGRARCAATARFHPSMHCGGELRATAAGLGPQLSLRLLKNCVLHFFSMPNPAHVHNRLRPVRAKTSDVLSKCEMRVVKLRHLADNADQFVTNARFTRSRPSTRVLPYRSVWQMK
jgi:hypothetical protein